MKYLPGRTRVIVSCRIEVQQPFIVDVLQCGLEYRAHHEMVDPIARVDDTSAVVYCIDKRLRRSQMLLSRRIEAA